MQLHSQGQPISGPFNCVNYLEMNEKIVGNPDFKATTGWLMRFKSTTVDMELGNWIFRAKIKAMYTMQTKLIYIGRKCQQSLRMKCQHLAIRQANHATFANHREVFKSAVLKGIKKLPVIYKKQNNSWMVTNIFIKWYYTVFIPEIKQYQIATGKSVSVLLLIDNAPSNPSNISMEKENGKFKVAFSLLAMKKCTTTVHRNGLEAAYMTAEAWATLKDTTLAKSWNKLLPSEETITASEELPNKCDQKDIQDWLVDDPGHQLLTDDEIIESVVDDQGSSENEEELRDDNQVDKGPSNEEIFH
ncbi:hypothetical protein LAZ67_4002076 [Cordylochernes scorpioides]|uniref:DDE-1 domain-containing protein n=1 Tax=Cordylochernes scorpioides TaxID=51811 RepID=A0ABY6KEC0_9ARAC|nr:hypothetical protein LAZ67_4002076 [Cordylochernes scorpioides]